MIPLSRAQHIALFIFGVVFQAMGMIEVPWIAPYRTAILSLAGALLLLTKSTAVIGLTPDRRQQGALVPALMEPDPTAADLPTEPPTNPGVKPARLGDPPDRRQG